METEIIIKYLKELAPNLSDLVIDSLIEAQRDLPEVVEVLNLEKRRRLRTILVDMVRIAANGIVFSSCSLIKIEFDQPEKIEITPEDILRYKLKFDLSDLTKELDKFGAMVNNLEFQEVKVIDVKPSVNPFDRQYKRKRR